MAQVADVIIVGAGAAGSLMAAKLAKAGKSVLVLEAGPAWSMGDLISSQIWARRLKWGGAAAPSREPSGHNASFGWGFGGAALHHYGTWPRPTEDTFKLHSLYGDGMDWPIAYSDLRPFYDRVQDEVGIAGDAAQEPWRPPGAPYPMPPMKTFRHGELLRGGFKALGLPVGPLPAIINTVWRNDRAPCLYDGWCDAGCPIGALGNPLATYLTQAQAAGAKFQERSTVTRIVMDGPAKARGVVYRDQKGQDHQVDAPVIILAGSVVENVRLMLASRGPGYEAGVGNANDLVGRYLMIEPGAHVFGLFAEPTEVHMGVSAGMLMHRQGHQGASPRPPGAYQWQIAPAMKPNDIFGVAFTRPDLFGQPFDAFIKKGVKHAASMAGFGADASDPENRVALGASLDRNGVPTAEIRHTVAPQTLALFNHMISEGLAVFKAAGAEESWAGPLAPGHISGGTIMGADPARSVTDSYGRSHQVGNLLIAGSGLFPSNGGTSPTFTLSVLALRSAERLASHWSDYAAA